MSTDSWLDDTRASYDTVAASYADIVGPMFDAEAHLRAALAVFAEHVGPGAPVADIGCGPGHATAHLHRLGLNASGIDLSPGMIGIARRNHPECAFEVGSMTDLAYPAETLAGIVAFWSLIHIPDETLPQVLQQFRRVLRPGGRLLAGFHAGTGSTLKTEGYGGHPMKVHVHRREPDAVADLLRDNGFTVEAQTLLGIGERLPGAILHARR
ncbi:class I SAM-dependent DNA methyltransferase [Phytomonospora endophytica]|uniref:Ubiquinone/menaquinone biosynthesis C-methylase UbiE n=1 Tax=Phytomonospora endophytica TaxID=714109 RepID=A0A841FX18_9ACTN|nr:class I SAM-dependent methyltransferase [Phytomonospora endophytica]MBB6037019.1 ubiquinone/menaquinone biosynthesis C-methylase UbiE [Phytomonospora endophytica]GIG69437.1 methyltransferase [Phytomonospora endophytica]